MMLSDDSDLDALLDAQSSDEDESDGGRRSGLERSIDDILNYFDEFGLDDVASAASSVDGISANSHARLENVEEADSGEDSPIKAPLQVQEGESQLQPQPLRPAGGTWSLDSEDDLDEVGKDVVGDEVREVENPLPSDSLRNELADLIGSEIAGSLVVEESFAAEQSWDDVVQINSGGKEEEGASEWRTSSAAQITVSDGGADLSSQTLGHEDEELVVTGIFSQLQEISSVRGEGDGWEAGDKDGALQNELSNEGNRPVSEGKVNRIPGAAFAAAEAASRRGRTRVTLGLESRVLEIVRSDTGRDEDVQGSPAELDSVAASVQAKSMRELEESVRPEAEVSPAGRNTLASQPLQVSAEKVLVESMAEPGDDESTRSSRSSSDFSGDAMHESSAAGGGPDALSMVDVADTDSPEALKATYASSVASERGSKDDEGTGSEADESEDESMESLEGERNRIPEPASSAVSSDEEQATWEPNEGSDVMEEQPGVSLDLSSDGAQEGKEKEEEEREDADVSFLDDISRQKEFTALWKAEESERKAASSGVHLEEGAAAQPMRLEGIHRGPPAIGVLQMDLEGSLSHALGTPAMRRDHGYPQALAVHTNFIAVGMSKGGVLVTYSKYVPIRNTESSESKAFFLGSPDKSPSAVSAMCFNQQGDMLLVGYSNGSVIVWDLTRAAVAKSISGEHSDAVIHAVILGQESQAAHQMKAITGDCKGLVLLHLLTTVPVIRRVTVSTQCLLDGHRNGITLSVSPMLPQDVPQLNGTSTAAHSGLSSNAMGLNSMMGGLAGVVGGVSDVGRKYLYEGSPVDESGTLVVFVTHQASLVVRLAATLEICAKLPRPQCVSDSAIPYTAWRRSKPKLSSNGQPVTSAVNGISNKMATNDKATVNSFKGANVDKDNSSEAGNKGSNNKTDGEILPVLSMAWGTKVFVMQLLKSELKITAEWDLDSTAAGVGWLEEQMLVVLTLDNQLHLFTKDGFEVERASLQGGQSGGDEGVTYLTYLLNSFGNPEKTFHASLAVRGSALYLLGSSQLWRASLMPWKDRIKVLQDAGDWMGAFQIAMELYDGKARGVTGLPSGLDARREAIMPTLLPLLSAYIDEAFEYLSLAYGLSSLVTKSEATLPNISLGGKHETTVAVTDSSVISEHALEVKDQYARVGGVAIEFCVHLKRTDVLFEHVFNKFDSVGQRGTFLELLEPYILKDMLGGLAPEVMQALVEHYSEKGWLQRVEQCILHMDIASLDFNQVVRLCRENGLYSALIYLFNKGLNDFKSPLEELLAVAQDPENPRCQSFGYKLLVYLKHCFLGLSFPPGHGTLPPDSLPALRVELLQFVLDPVGDEGGRALMKSRVRQGKMYPRLRYLLELDTKATLLVLSLAFPEDGPLGVGNVVNAFYAGHDPETPQVDGRQNSTEASTYMQAVVNALVHVMEAAQYTFSVLPESTSESSEEASGQSWPSEEAASSILHFVAHFVAAGRAVVASNTLSAIFENLTTVTSLDERMCTEKEEVMLELLQGLPQTEWNSSVSLERAQQAHFWQVCALIHKKNGDMISALDFYLLDVKHPEHTFSFIISTLHPEDGLKDQELLKFRAAVINRISTLVTLSRQTTLVVVLEYFSKENDTIMMKLGREPYLLFIYMKALMDVHTYGHYQALPEVHANASSELYLTRKDDSVLVDTGFKLSDLLQRSGLQFTDEMAELYVELLCQFDPKSVLKFLESYENYRLEHCLKLCQEYDITDAAVFILERVGDVASALSLVLSDVKPRLFEMDNAVLEHFATPRVSRRLGVPIELDIPEVTAVASVMREAVALCQRNTLRLDPNESELLWFRLLDTFVDPLCDLNMSNNALLPETSHKKKPQKHGKGVFLWNVAVNRAAADYVRRKLTKIMGEIVEGMMGYVPLTDIMEKILRDHGNHEFRDFRRTILGMLSAYGFECALLGTAKQLLEDDIHSNVSTLKLSRAHAHAPYGSTCCMCGLNLTEDPESMPAKPDSAEGSGNSNGEMADEEAGVYVFACGHAAHSSCFEGSRNGKSSSRSCPVCSFQKPTKDKETFSSDFKQQQAVQSRHREKPKAAEVMDTSSMGSSLSGNIWKNSGRSRWELLNSLQRGKAIDDLGPLLELRLSPPNVSRKRQAAGSRSPSSVRKAGSAGRRDHLVAKRDFSKVRSVRPAQLGIRQNLADTLAPSLSATRKTS